MLSADAKLTTSGNAGTNGWAPRYACEWRRISSQSLPFDKSQQWFCASCLTGGGTIVLTLHDNVYGPGGQSVYNDPKNGWVIVYHYVEKTIDYADGDKRFGWNKINWSNGWPSV
ncbi:hypothetical protein AC579_5820 [Pseudocercospora musae]|uniref:Uncharacterized protein n=1 Tax=Pseudocercospora musae TaxID=113226 RepID=A0A139I380_9PEZI|nr:hypothetical protein AC579_5820 [Pseudocercospora musae]